MKKPNLEPPYLENNPNLGEIDSPRIVLRFTLVFTWILTGCMEQNYSIEKFKPDDKSQIVQQVSANSPTTNPDPDPLPSPSPSPSPSPCTETCRITNGVGIQTCNLPKTCVLTHCDEGYVPDSLGFCVLPSVNPNFECTHYEKLIFSPTEKTLSTQSGSLSIPQQNETGSGTCYYYPMTQEGISLSGSSSQTGTSPENHDSSVLSRIHDIPSDQRSLSTVWHPYKMARFDGTVTLAGHRKVRLIGGSISSQGELSEAAISIDNFFLAGVYPRNTSLRPSNLRSYFSAWGTGDSTISSPTEGTGIAFHPEGIQLTTNGVHTYSNGHSTPYSTQGIQTSSPYVMIDLIEKAARGTATVSEVILNSRFAPNVATTIDFRALDCGGSRNLKPIYLVFE